MTPCINSWVKELSPLRKKERKKKDFLASIVYLFWLCLYFVSNLNAWPWLSRSTWMQRRSANFEHEPFPSVWIVKYIYFFVHKTGHMFSESFHRILKVKQGHEPSVIKNEELLLALFKLEFPNSTYFDYPWKERRILSSNHVQPHTGTYSTNYPEKQN